MLHHFVLDSLLLLLLLPCSVRWLVSDVFKNTLCTYAMFHSEQDPRSISFQQSGGIDCVYERMAYSCCHEREREGRSLMTFASLLSQLSTAAAASACSSSSCCCVYTPVTDFDYDTESSSSGTHIYKQYQYTYIRFPFSLRYV